MKFKNACKAANNGFSNMYVHLVCSQVAEGLAPIAWLGELSIAYLACLLCVLEIVSDVLKVDELWHVF